MSIQPNAVQFALAAPYIPGVTIFVPADALASPVYIFVNYLDGKTIQVSTYAVLCINLTNELSARTFGYRVRGREP